MGDTRDQVAERDLHLRRGHVLNEHRKLASLNRPSKAPRVLNISGLRSEIERTISCFDRPDPRNPPLPPGIPGMLIRQLAAHKIRRREP